MRLQRMPQWCLRIDPIGVAPAHTFAFQDPRLLELCHDPLNTSLGQPDLGRDVTQGLFPVCRKTYQDVGVIAQERPAPSRRYIGHFTYLA